MKYILFFLLSCFVSAAWAQIPTNPIVTSSVDADPEVMEEEVCWTTGGVDSSLTRFYYVNPSDAADNQILFYVNAMGAVVDVSGGTLTLGYCGCCEEGTGSTVFDSDRPILRTPTVGTVIGGTSVTDWLDYWYFAPPTLSLSRSGGESTTVEVGTETTYTFTATTNNPGGATLSNGHLFVTGADTLLNFTSTTGGSAGLTFSPKQTPVDTFDNTFYQVRASQQWAEGAESGTIFSNAINLAGVYPVLYGMVADTATAFADPYGTLNKLVQTEGNKTVSFTGTGLIIYGFPQTWADENLSSIIDPNGFNVTASFTRVTYHTVTSTGLTNNYVDEPYVFYFLNTGSTTTSASNYTFNR